MDILVLGDSFSASCECWPNYLADYCDLETKQENLKVKNLAQGCSSNHTITRRLIEELTEKKSSYDFVIIQWTIDFRGSHNREHFTEPYSDRIEGGVASYESGDTWKRPEFINESNLSLRWLEHIILAQYFLQMYNLDYKMFFGWDVNFSRCWELFPKLYEKIDFTKWWGMPFVTDNYLPQKFSSPSGGFNCPDDELIERNLFFDWGLGEWIRCNIEDGFQEDAHPTNHSQKRFAVEVVKEWIK